MARRSGKFYSRNEKQTLKALGLTPAPASGAGWVVKEDGENDNVMVQLKSTDASSYRFDMLDIKKLEYHADVSNKIPIFLVQFLKQDRIYALLPVEYVKPIIEGKKKGDIGGSSKGLVEIEEVVSVSTKPKIKSSASARAAFHKALSDKYKK